MLTLLCWCPDFVLQPNVFRNYEKNEALYTLLLVLKKNRVTAAKEDNTNDTPDYDDDAHCSLRDESYSKCFERYLSR